MTARDRSAKLANSRSAKGQSKIMGASKPEYEPLNKKGNRIIPTSEPRVDERSEEKEADLKGNKIVEINKLLAEERYGVGQQIKVFQTQLEKDLEGDQTFKDPGKYVA